jgi:hypothetical protein
MLLSAGAKLPLLLCLVGEGRIELHWRNGDKSGVFASTLKSLQPPLNAEFSCWMRIAHRWQIRMLGCNQVG